jgi:ElaB/YqjD/DUF883 family membrane-anchored ribosome-binding protein
MVATGVRVLSYTHCPVVWFDQSGEKRMSSYSKVASDLNKELHAFVRDTEDLLAATGGLAGDQIEEVRNRANRSLKSLRKEMRNIPGQVKEQLHDVEEAAEKAIRRNPLPWVAVAAGVGLLLGILSMTRSR